RYAILCCLALRTSNKETPFSTLCFEYRLASARGLMRLSIIMPCYNEARTLREILALVRAVQLDKEIIAVDDHSSDDTYRILCEEALADPQMVVVRHPTNRGKGAAV